MVTCEVSFNDGNCGSHDTNAAVCIPRARMGAGVPLFKDQNIIMAEEENPNTMEEEVKDDVGDIAPFDPTKKKKKKKKPVMQDAAGEESADTLAEKTQSLSGTY